jgi:4-hydroxyphenylacetate 3-monooxygenase
VKNGEQHLRSLQDGRDIRLNGERITNPTSHQAFRGACRTSAQLYDFQCRPDKQALMTFETPTGRRVNRCWQLPRNYAELLERRRALEGWAETHLGFFGRPPDHVASTLSGFMMGIQIFEAYDTKRAARCGTITLMPGTTIFT